MRSAAVAVPSHFSTGFSVAGSMTRNVGQTSMGNFSRNPALPSFSVSISSQTNRPAIFTSAGSWRTVARMKLHVFHQGAQVSTKTGTLRAFASAMAFGQSSEIQAGPAASAKAGAASRAASSRERGNCMARGL